MLRKVVRYLARELKIAQAKIATGPLGTERMVEIDDKWVVVAGKMVRDKAAHLFVFDETTEPGGRKVFVILNDVGDKVVLKRLLFEKKLRQ